MSGIFHLGGMEDNTALVMGELQGRSRWGWLGRRWVGGGGVGRAVAEARRISITACCCYQGYSDMRANCRCQADNSEAQLETLGEGR